MNLRTRNSIIRHIANLGNSDKKIAVRAERFLIRHYADRAQNELIEACRDLNPQVRLRAGWVLAHSRASGAFEPILDLTNDEDERVRYDSTIALGILGDVRAIEPLKAMLLAKDESRPADGALTRFGSRVMPVLLELFESDDPSIRLSVVNVAGRFAKEWGDSSAKKLLRRAIKDQDGNVREDAQFWLDEH